MKAHWLDNLDVQTAFDALSADKSLPISAKIKIARFRVALLEKAKEYGALKLGFLEEYAERNEAGESVKEQLPNGSIQYKIQDGKLEELQSIMREIGNNEMQVAASPIPVTEIGDTKSISSDQLLVLIEAGILEVESGN